jgi:hypothetical protein
MEAIMQAHSLAITLFASLCLASLPAPVAAQACAGHNATSAGHDHASMACCAAHDHAVAPASSAVPETAVQTAVVTFRDPVLVGDRILLGRYVIEHDTNRMARGEPCTHIYEASDTRLPVVAFRCTHLTRRAPSANTVFLRRSGTYPLQQLLDFQFAGEPASHGVPAVR